MMSRKIFGGVLSLAVRKILGFAKSLQPSPAGALIVSVDVVRANHQRSLRGNFPIGLNQNDGSAADIQLGAMVSHSDAQGKSERLPNVRVGQFWQHGTSRHGPIREHAWILRRPPLQTQSDSPQLRCPRLAEMVSRQTDDG
jgi:hypothetical protein